MATFTFTHLLRAFKDINIQNENDFIIRIYREVLLGVILETN